MNLKIAVLCPHPDDFELGFATGVRRLVLSGCHVKLIYLTDGRHGVNPSTEAIAVRRAEAAAARKKAGIEDYCYFDIEDGKLLDICLNNEDMRRLLKELSGHVRGYEVIVSTATSDMHQDHIAAAKIGKELFFASGAKAIIHYMVWLYPDFYFKELEIPDHILALDLSNEDMDHKLKLIRCHQSQVIKRPYDLIAKSRDEYFARLFNFKNYCEVVGLSCKDEDVYETLINSLSPVREVSDYLPGICR